MTRNFAPLEADTRFGGGDANPHGGRGEGVNHAPALLVEHLRSPVDDSRCIIKSDIFRLRQRRTKYPAEKIDHLDAKLALPCDVQFRFVNLREPPARGVADVRETQAGIDSRRARKHRKPVRHRRGEAAMDIEQNAS